MPVTPTDEQQARSGIFTALIDLARNLPGSVHLSQRRPTNTVDHSLGPVTPDVKCRDSERRYSISYWLTGISKSEEQKYADLIEGFWAGEPGWSKDTSETYFHEYVAPGGYRYIVSVDESYSSKAPTVAAVWVHAESPCMPKDVFTGEWMPEILKPS